MQQELRVGGYQLTNLVQISEGGFGLIFKCQDRVGKSLVLKKCSVQRQESFDTVQKEVQILKRFKGNEGVVSILGESISMQSGEAYILLEMCNGGHLLDKLNEAAENKSSQAGLGHTDVCTYFTQVLSAMTALHTAKPRFIVHRDIKCENVLFSAPPGHPMRVKLCDFGSCVEGVTPLRDVAERSAAEEIIGKESTPGYRAPEMVDLYMRNHLCEKTDVWALGVLLYCMCFIKHPFQEAGTLGILSGVVFPRQGTHSCDMRLVTVMQRMLDFDPEARPTVQQCLSFMGAITTNTTLPSYEIPAAVQAIKHEREVLAAKRAAKNKALEQKKSGMAGIIAKKAAQGGLNLKQDSVAARRLAQMRGGAGGGGMPSSSGGGASASTSSVSSSFITSSDGAGDFDPFAGERSFDVGSPKSGSPLYGSDADDAADFSSAGGGSSAFGGDTDFPTGNLSGGGFDDVFAAAGSNVDAFATAGANTATADVFGSSASASDDLFASDSGAMAAPVSASVSGDGFSDWGSEQNNGSGGSYALPQAAASGGGDGFDNFVASGAGASVAAAQGNDFDSFGASTGSAEGASSSDGFDMGSVMSSSGGGGGGGGGGGLGQLFPTVTDAGVGGDADFGGPPVAAASSGFDQGSGFGDDVFSSSSGPEPFTSSTSFTDNTSSEDFESDAFSLPSAPASARNSIAFKLQGADMADLMGALDMAGQTANDDFGGGGNFLAPPTPQQSSGNSRPVSMSGMDSDLFGSPAPAPMRQQQQAAASADLLSMFDGVTSPNPNDRPAMMMGGGINGGAGMSASGMSAFDAMDLNTHSPTSANMPGDQRGGQQMRPQMQHMMDPSGKNAYGASYAQLSSPSMSPKMANMPLTPSGSGGGSQYMSTPMRTQQMMFGGGTPGGFVQGGPAVGSAMGGGVGASISVGVGQQQIGRMAGTAGGGGSGTTAQRLQQGGAMSANSFLNGGLQLNNGAGALNNNNSTTSKASTASNASKAPQANMGGADPFANLNSF